MASIETLNYLSILFMLFLGYWLIMVMKKDFIFILMTFIGQLWILVSCVYIESTESYIIEQQRYAYLTGASFRLVFYDLIFFLIIIFAYLFLREQHYEFKKSHQCAISTRQNAIIFLIFIIYVILIIHILYSAPLVNMFDRIEMVRFNFWQNYAVVPELEIFERWANIFVLILGYYLSQSQNRNQYIFSISTFILILIYNILRGNKFTPFIILSWLIAIPIFSSTINNVRSRSIKKALERLVLFLVVPIIFASIIYYYNSFWMNFNVFDAIVYRTLALQGHVWWGIDELVFIYNNSVVLH